VNLICNAIHHSHQHTYLVEDKNGDICAVRKLTFCQNGLDELNNESQGLRWYMGEVGVPANTIILQEDIGTKTGKLILRYMPGETVEILSSPKVIIPHFASMLEHYKIVFSKCDFRVSHGDYSVNNHIFNGDKVNWIIDWEHFNKELPPGYDLVYAFSEPFFFWLLHKKNIPGSAINEGKNFLKKAQKLIGFDKSVLKNPGEWLNKEGTKHKKVWGSQFAKMPITNQNQRWALRQLDDMLGQ
jgi:hypothetical protein